MRRLKDILHAEEMEKTAQKAEAANEAKTRFLFNMSHDIRTPMNAIIGFSELLEKHIDEKDKVTYYIGKIKSSSSLLLSLINYVLEMARIESGKADLRLDTGHFQELRDSLQTVFEPALKEKGLTYSTHLDIQHPYIVYDKTKTSEILLNIVGNSIKYTPRGGHIRLDISEIPSERSDVATYRMIIEDTGIGMSEEYLPHIFEEFTREHTSTENKIAGTGLGLPIVKSLVDLMGGTIQIESKVNEGTKTTIQIPFLIATQEQIEESQTYSPYLVTNHALGKRILMAEDNKLNAEIAETILQENGFEVDCVEDGCQCLALLQEKPEDYYGLILMDIQMPNLNGYETTRLIRNLKNQRATIPIIAMTANAFDEDKKKAFAAGMNAHIAKPIDVEVLLHTLEKFVQ
ncbi:ATP-binding protein [Mediterraneibacter sp. HCN-7094]